MKPRRDSSSTQSGQQSNNSLQDLTNVALGLLGPNNNNPSSTTGNTPPTNIYNYQTTTTQTNPNLNPNNNPMMMQNVAMMNSNPMMMNSSSNPTMTSMQQQQQLTNSTNQFPLLNLMNQTIQQRLQSVIPTNEDRKKITKILFETEDIVTKILQLTQENTIDSLKQRNELIHCCLDQMFLLFTTNTNLNNLQQQELKYIYISLTFLAKKHVEIFDTDDIKLKLISYLYLNNKHFGNQIISNITGPTTSNTTTTGGVGVGGATTGNIGGSGPLTANVSIGGSVSAGNVNPSKEGTTTGSGSSTTTIMKKGTFLCLLCCDVLYKLFTGELYHGITEDGKLIENNRPPIEEWSIELIFALINDCLEDRIWCESDYAKEFVEYICTGMRDVDGDYSTVPTIVSSILSGPNNVNTSVSANSSGSSGLNLTTTLSSSVNSTTMNVNGWTNSGILASNQFVYHDTKTLIQIRDIILIILFHNQNYKPKRKIENIIKLCYFSSRIREVRCFSAKLMESWLNGNNQIVVKNAKELLQRMSLFVREDFPDMYNEGDRMTFELIVNMKFIKQHQINLQIESICQMIKNNSNYPAIALRKFLQNEVNIHHKGSNSFKNLLLIFKSIPSYRERHLGYTLQELVAAAVDNLDYFKNIKILVRKIIKHSNNFDFVDLCSSLFTAREQMKQQAFSYRKRWVLFLFELVRLIIITMCILTPKELSTNNNNTSTVTNMNTTTTATTATTTTGTVTGTGVGNTTIDNNTTTTTTTLDLRTKISQVQREGIEWIYSIIPFYLTDINENRTEEEKILEYYNLIYKLLFVDYLTFSDINTLNSCLGENTNVALTGTTTTTTTATAMTTATGVGPTTTTIPTSTVTTTTISGTGITSYNFEQIKYWLEDLPCEEKTLLLIQKLSLIDKYLKNQDALFLIQYSVLRAARIKKLNVTNIEVINNLINLCKFQPILDDITIPFKDDILVRSWYWNAVIICLIIICLNPNYLCSEIMKISMTFKHILNYLIKNQLNLLENEQEDYNLQNLEKEYIDKYGKRSCQLLPNYDIFKDENNLQLWIETFMIDEKILNKFDLFRVMPLDRLKDLRKYDLEFNLGRTLRSCRQPIDFLLEMITKDGLNSLQWLDQIICQEDYLITILPSTILCEYLLMKCNYLQQQNLQSLQQNNLIVFPFDLIIQRLRNDLNGNDNNTSYEVLSFFIKKLVHDDYYIRKLSQSILRNLFLPTTTVTTMTTANVTTTSMTTVTTNNNNNAIQLLQTEDEDKDNEYDWIYKIRSLKCWGISKQLLGETFSKLVEIETNVKFLTCFIDFVHSKYILQGQEISLILSKLLLQRKYFSENLFLKNFKDIYVITQKIFYEGFSKIRTFQAQYENVTFDGFVLVHFDDLNCDIKMDEIFVKGLIAFLEIQLPNIGYPPYTKEFEGIVNLFTNNNSYYITLSQNNLQESLQNNLQNRIPIFTKELALKLIGSSMNHLVERSLQILTMKDYFTIIYTFHKNEIVLQTIFTKISQLKDLELQFILFNELNNEELLQLKLYLEMILINNLQQYNGFEQNVMERLLNLINNNLQQNNLQNNILQQENKEEEENILDSELMEWFNFDAFHANDNDINNTFNNNNILTTTSIMEDDEEEYNNTSIVSSGNNNISSKEDKMMIEEEDDEELLENKYQDELYLQTILEKAFNNIENYNNYNNIDNKELNRFLNYLLESKDNNTLKILQCINLFINILNNQLNNNEQFKLQFILQNSTNSVYLLSTINYLNQYFKELLDNNSLQNSLQNNEEELNNLIKENENLLFTIIEQSHVKQNVFDFITKYNNSLQHNLQHTLQNNLQNNELQKIIETIINNPSSNNDISILQLINQLNKIINNSNLENKNLQNTNLENLNNLEYLLIKLFNDGSSIVEYIIEYLYESYLYQEENEKNELLNYLLNIFNNILNYLQSNSLQSTNNNTLQNSLQKNNELQKILMSGIFVDAFLIIDPSCQYKKLRNLIFIKNNEFKNIKNYISIYLMNIMINNSSRKELTNNLDELIDLNNLQQSTLQSTNTLQNNLLVQPILDFIQVYKSMIYSLNNSKLRLPIIMSIQTSKFVIQCILQLMEEWNFNNTLQQNTLQKNKDYNLILLQMLSNLPYSNYFNLLLDNMSQNELHLNEILQFILQNYIFKTLQNTQPFTKIGNNNQNNIDEKVMALARWMYCCFPRHFTHCLNQQLNTTTVTTSQSLVNQRNDNLNNNLENDKMIIENNTIYKNRKNKEKINQKIIDELLTPLITNDLLKRNLTSSLDQVLHRLCHLLSFYSNQTQQQSTSNHVNNHVHGHVNNHVMESHQQSHANEISTFAFSIFRQYAFQYPYLVIKYLDNILSLIQTSHCKNNLNLDELKPTLKILTNILGILDALQQNLFKFKIFEIFEIYFDFLNLILNNNENVYFIELISKFIDFICNFIFYKASQLKSTVTNQSQQLQQHTSQEKSRDVEEEEFNNFNFLLKRKDLLLKMNQLFIEIPKIKLLLDLINNLQNNNLQYNLLLINNLKMPLNENEILEMKMRLRYFTLQNDIYLRKDNYHVYKDYNNYNNNNIEYSIHLNFNSSQLKSKNRQLIDTLTDLENISQYEPSILLNFIPNLLDLLILNKLNKNILDLIYQLIIKSLNYNSKYQFEIIPFYLNCLLNENLLIKEMAIIYSYDLFPFCCNLNEWKQLLLERLFIIAEKQQQYRIGNVNNNITTTINGSSVSGSGSGGSTLSQLAMKMLTKIIDMYISIN